MLSNPASIRGGNVISIININDLPVLIVLAAGFLSGLLTNVVKPWINTRFKDGTTAHDVAIRAFNGVVSILASVILYATSSAHPDLKGIGTYVLWGIVATIASVFHYHIAPSKSGVLAIVPDKDAAAKDTPVVVIPGNFKVK